MLNVDLVPVRRKNGELHLTPISGKTLSQHIDLAEQVMAVVLDCEGQTREQIQAEILAIGQTPQQSRIVKGFAKLIEDALTFEEDRGKGAAALREAVFERAALAWQGLRDSEHFDRDAVLRDVGSTTDLTPEAVDAELFIDLPAAQRVLRSVDWTAAHLVEHYDRSRVAAILLRAVSVSATFGVKNAHDVRALFRVLKFRRLLFELTQLESERYKLVLTGPYSLFDAITKYGLQLALTWPSLALQSDLQLEADLRWGKTNEKLKFHWSNKASVRGPGSSHGTADSHSNSNERSLAVQERNADMDPEIVELMLGLGKAIDNVSVNCSDRVLDLPGVGLCVPDLCCRFDDGREVFVEVLGYWSRDAVWRRVELVEQGLAVPILFLVSSRLRVSEEVLDNQSSGALYIYRGRINPASVAAKVTELASRQTPAGRRPVRPQRK